MMTKFSCALLISALAATANAWSMDSSNNLNRRQIFGVFGAAAGAAVMAQDANAATAKTGAASPFTGFYDDPNHPNCLRQVKVVGSPLRGDGSRSAYPVIEVTGYDGSGNTCTERPTVSLLEALFWSRLNYVAWLSLCLCFSCLFPILLSAPTFGKSKELSNRRLPPKLIFRRRGDHPSSQPNLRTGVLSFRTEINGPS